MRSQHVKVANVFPSNGVRRCDVQAVIEATVGASFGGGSYVSDFIRTGEYMGCQATPDQYARVARQMADDGLLWQCTVGGDYCYRWWADAPAS